MTDLGDRMKLYEGLEGKRCMPLLPICVRLDGKCFSQWTKGLTRPYDERMSTLMLLVTSTLVVDTNAVIGYTQSDEISLIYYSSTHASQVFLDGRIQKMASILASMTTAHFNAGVPNLLPERIGRSAFFDCRVWTVPTLEEAANALLWRERDATKNAISMATRHYYSHAQVTGKTGPEQQELLFRAGVNFNDYPDFFKRGSFVGRRMIDRPFSVEEIELLPPLHEARTNPNLIVRRGQVQRIDMPPFDKVTNRVEVIFEGAIPETGDES